MNDVRRTVWWEDPWLFLRTMTLVAVVAGAAIYGALVAGGKTVTWRVELPPVKPYDKAAIVEDCLKETNYFDGGGINPEKLRKLLACIDSKGG